MSFWEEHEAREAEATRVARLPQDAPSNCATCGHHGADVLFGICAGCHSRWYPED